MPNVTTGSVRFPTAVDGEKLRRRRIEAGLTARALGERASVSHNHICDIERGRRQPRPVLLARLATALAITPADLLFPENPDGVQ